MNRLILVALLLTVSGGSAVAQSVAIVGAKIHTAGPNGTIENATIVSVNGKITGVGNNVRIPTDARIIDASGKIITPGLFSPLGRLGLVEVSSSAGPVDSMQRGTQFTASFDVADAYNPRSTLVAINRIEGVTRAAILPSAGSVDDFGNHGHVISGLGAIVNLGDAEAMSDTVDRRHAALVVTLGEAGSEMGGGTRTGAWLALRNALDEAVDYRDNKRDFERGLRREYVYSAVDLDALQDVIAGRVPLLVNVHRASDIEILIQLTRAYRISAIVAGGAEAWMLADELADAKISVILTVTDNLPGNFDRLNTRRGAANILAQAGVRIALTDGQSQTHNARNITQSAGNAVADGLDWEAALRAITIAPAEMFGVAKDVGSLETGKAADFVIWPADPFELTTYAEAVYINGVAVPMQSRQTLLRDRYLDTESTTPPAYRR